MHTDQIKKQKGKKLDKENLNKVRVPRPLGLTLSLITYHQQKTRNDKENNTIKDIGDIKRQVVELWSMNGMRLNNRTYTVQQLATYTNLPIDTINIYMMDSMKKLGKVWDKADAAEVARALFSVCLQKNSEILSESQSQYEILKASQAGRYQPFISTTVNQALTNMISATTPIHNLLKVITEKQPINIIYQHQINPNQHTELITSERAMELVKEAGPSMLNDPLLAASQVEQYRLANLLPDVNARTQDLRGIGIKYDGTPPVIGSKGEQVEIPQTKKEKKDERRRRSAGLIEINEVEAEEFKA